MTKQITKIPRVLHNTQNAFYLIGRRRWINQFDEALEMALRFWIDKGGDYLALANGLEKEYPSIIMVDSPKDVQFETDTHKWVAPTQPTLTVAFSGYPNVPREDVRISLEPLLFTAESVIGKYVVYLHDLLNLEDNPELNAETIKGMPRPSHTNKIKGIYTGITRKGWDIRHSQHISAANCGSPYLFHRALRGSTLLPSVHTVYGWGLSFEDAMNTEEEVVEKHSLYPLGLNMIPGGFAGIRYLGKHGFKVHNNRQGRRNWEHRERTISQFAVHCVRTNRPNPLMAANWKNDDYALSVILNNKKNFNAEDVRLIRELHRTGFGPHDIATRMMVDVGRVHRLLRGVTYRRVS